jgi:hypothetical protein
LVLCRPRPIGLGTALFFGVYQSFLQAFFMALLFFIAGYFAAAAYDRKGFAPFVRDRLSAAWRADPALHVRHRPADAVFSVMDLGAAAASAINGSSMSGTASGCRKPGRCGFARALLLFSVVYGLIRRAAGASPKMSLGDDRALASAWPASSIVMAASTFLVRIGIDEGASVLNVHPGDFPQYVLMFAAGALGFRGNWMTGFPDACASALGLLALAASVPLIAALILFGGGLQGETQQYSGGFNWVSAGKCLWEALVCVGMGLLMLAVYRRSFDWQGPVSKWLSENAFGVYLIHPPILIGSAILLHALALNAIAKALLLTALAAAGSFAASAPRFAEIAAACDRIEHDPESGCRFSEKIMLKSKR